ncbi:MAG: terminase family protein [Pseudomonadota bacterium]
MRSGADWLVSETSETTDKFIRSLSDGELRALPYLFEFWALPHQLPPKGDWRTWLIMGGRGSGKTRAGAEWVRSVVEGSLPNDRGECRRVALVSETYKEAREVMVFGDSGIIACSPPDRRPVWVETKRQLQWPNGATATIYSATSYDALRGPQFDAAWVDELAKWSSAQEAWDQLQFSLRLGKRPRMVVTTTPQNVPLLKRLVEDEAVVKTTAKTRDNRAYLSDGFVDRVEAQYEGTRLGRQELDGKLLEDVDAALWPAAVLDGVRSNEDVAFDRVVVAVDPSVTSKASSDACGIVVVGAVTQGSPKDWRAVVLEDATVEASSPTVWAKAVVDAYERHDASRVVAEVNQGGDLVEEMIRQVAPTIPFRAVTASTSKTRRAEPVASLYEQGRVAHRPGLGALEAEMRLMSIRGFHGGGSPDRVDALVWALTELMLKPAAAAQAKPSVRTLG